MPDLSLSNNIEVVTFVLQHTIPRCGGRPSSFYYISVSQHQALSAIICFASNFLHISIGVPLNNIQSLSAICRHIASIPSKCGHTQACTTDCQDLEPIASSSLIWWAIQDKNTRFKSHSRETVNLVQLSQSARAVFDHECRCPAMGNSNMPVPGSATFIYSNASKSFEVWKTCSYG